MIVELTEVVGGGVMMISMSMIKGLTDQADVTRILDWLLTDY